MADGVYGKPARPFELWNIGNYETVYWQEKQDEYLRFMLMLYHAQFLTGFRYLHGRKGERAVHVGPLNAPVTMEEIAAQYERAEKITLVMYNLNTHVPGSFMKRCSRIKQRQYGIDSSLCTLRSMEAG